MRAVTSLGLIVSAAAVLSACSDTSGTEPPPPPTLVLTVAPSNAVITRGNSLPLIARLVDPDGNGSTPAGVAWTSTDPLIASVQSSGLVQGLSEGSTGIIASWGTARGFARVRVVTRMKPAPDNPVCPVARRPAPPNSMIPKC